MTITTTMEAAITEDKLKSEIRVLECRINAKRAHITNLETTLAELIAEQIALKKQRIELL